MKKVSIFISKFEDVEHFVNVMDRLDGSVKLKYGFCTAEARSVISIAPLVGIKPLELWIYEKQDPEIEKQIQPFLCCTM